MGMDWEQLLARKRLGAAASGDDRGSRTDFQRDFDRIVFCSAFRRMQDKTQVFPLSRSDYVRTRLTHSLEASCVGRTLGTLVGEELIKRHRLDGYEPSDFGAICAAACLAHDIGNPPFGHSGEDGIRHWAESTHYGSQRVGALQDSEREDFLRFEGNAQGFRILTRLQSPDGRGLQLTSATLATFTKYPRESWIGSSSAEGVSTRKHGFCAADRDRFSAVASEVGLIRRDPLRAWWSRHPLAYLVEAADDICYRVIDIEDGHRLGRLSYLQAESLLRPLIQSSADDLDQRIEAIDEPRARVEFLRAKAINSVIFQVRDNFLDIESELLAGRNDTPLLQTIPLAAEMQQLLDVAFEQVYCAPEVVEIETAGFEVISELLERFVPVVDELAERGDRATARSRMMIRLIPAQFIGSGYRPDPNPYRRLLGITDYIAGMTDSYAVSLYKKVTGISLPDG